MHMNKNKIVIRYETIGGRKGYYPGNVLARKLLQFIDPRPLSKKKSFTKEQIELGIQLGMDIYIQVIQYKRFEDELN